ncbi:hypothetical protein K7X08_025617 [Anisodus acutangulus]|uniref:Uncharacterized protein n=1 Tax=Anisodus acutangulus TaxID=402998 RepID=A0A9Q1LVL2_9SOLA|nr:hypothetical protein K7X08_025617 [Anisodus acutangulus]
MDTVPEALDEAKLEIENLRANYQSKAELCENLNRANNELLTKNQEANLKVEKLTHELSGKEDELAVTKQLHEATESKLEEKESAVKHLSSANDKLRADYAEMIRKFEEENRGLALALDGANSTNTDQEQQIRSLKQKIEWLREFASASQQKKSSEALAHEESRRKLLEVQLAESKTSFDSVFTEYEESKSIIERLTSQRDKEIANLRDVLGTRDTLHKEMEYQFRRVEQENHELMTSLKELQEAKIQEAGSASSLSKLRNKLRGLEQVHKDCFGNLKAKEAEWASKLEQLTGELDCCKSSVQSKDTLITELRDELETCESLTLQLTLQNEETFMMLLVLKSQFFEFHQRIADDYASMELEKREGVENISTLIKQLNTKNEALVRVHEDLEEEREKVALLSEKVESLNSEEQRQLPLQREVDTMKEMLKEASTSQIHLKEQVLSTKSDLEQVRDALDRANEELAESFSEGSELEFEMQVWKSVAEKLKANLEENHQMRRQVEASLLAQANVEFDLKQERESLELKLEEKDRRVNELHQQLFDLNEELQRREQTAFLSENIEHKKISQDLQKEVEYLEQEWVRKELEGAILAQVEAETKHKNEKESLHQLVEEKDHRIYDLQQLVNSLENEFESSTGSFSARLSEMQADVDLFHKTWEKMRTAEILKEIEIQMRDLVIVELENEIYQLQKKVEHLEKHLSNSVGNRTELEAELEAKRSEIDTLQFNLEKQVRSSDIVIKKLRGEKAKLLEDVKKLSSDKDKLFDTFMGLSERINMLSKEDVQLTDSLERMGLFPSLFCKIFPRKAELSHILGTCKNHERLKKYSPIQNTFGRSRWNSCCTSLSSFLSWQDSWSIHHLRGCQVKKHVLPYKSNLFKCNSFLKPDQAFDISVKNAAIILKRSYNSLQGSPHVLKLVPAIGILGFAVLGLAPLLRQSRNVLLHKNDNSWGKSGTYHVMTFYLQPLLLWTGAMLVCRALDPMVLPTEASQIVKQRLLNFVKSLSTVLAFAYCLSSVIQQAQRFFMETSDANDTRNMGFQFAGRAVYTAVWVAAVSLFMELLGFSTQKWLTAGGLGTVLLTLAGREIFTNFLSSIMIHATRPFVLNEWIQTKIEGYEVSGTVEHVGWWSPTIIRGEDREAVHIPNHKFTMNVVRNLTQKTHWRIKTHLAISHLDVSKINNIVADMRKVLAKNPQVEQQRLHRRVFLENVNPENQALLILISCFVKTSHFEEYLCVKEAILLDLLRVIRHHRARLATPIRTVQKIYSDADLDNMPYDSAFNRGAASTRPLLLI